MKNKVKLKTATLQDGPDVEEQTVRLWGRMGFEMRLTPAELVELRDDPHSVFLSLLGAGRMELSGETYFPDVDDDRYTNCDLNELSF